MTPATRKLVVRVHLWLGLPAGAVLLVVALTGAVLVFEQDLDRAWHPELWRYDATALALPLDTLRATAQTHAPGLALREVRLHRGAPAEFRFHRGPHVRLDPATGALLGTRARGDSFFGFVEKLHTELVLGATGRWLVSASSVALVALLATGLVLWWPKQWRMLKSAVSPALGRKGRALHFSLHNTLGFWSALPLLALGLTGAILGFKPLGDALKSLGTGARTPLAAPAALSDAALPPASLDTLAASAAQVFPDWRQLRLHVPRPGREDDDGKAAGYAAGLDGAWRGEAVDAGTPHEHARSRAYLDPRTAGLMHLMRFEELPLGARLRALTRPLHDGSILGRPSQVLAFLAVLLLPVLSVTGFALWWLRRRAELARKKCAQSGLVNAAAKFPVFPGGSPQLTGSERSFPIAARPLSTPAP